MSETLAWLAPVTAICDHGPPEANARSTLKPCSFAELSVQMRLIWLDETADAARLVGAAGTVAGVVAKAVLE